ncbi:hypothetical protein L228DRAFT_245530 [Xylona heveae TC161]|uniref:Uncharacterized protein n=1 Tax=Xylona heveae (strain CBS 132557 / TC161) TaxID=1328760 RepID=A0A165I939_XYLHT|nr:hypothetical protein L228DRAFT_245530 [Xylona heveae TC161]KZF24568.1 hypothetical protein L228DRAFT_245530 [Xylona heveae TC161]
MTQPADNDKRDPQNGTVKFDPTLTSTAHQLRASECQINGPDLCPDLVQLQQQRSNMNSAKPPNTGLASSVSLTSVLPATSNSIPVLASSSEAALGASSSRTEQQNAPTSALMQATYTSPKRKRNGSSSSAGFEYRPSSLPLRLQIGASMPNSAASGHDLRSSSGPHISSTVDMSSAAQEGSSYAGSTTGSAGEGSPRSAVARKLGDLHLRSGDPGQEGGHGVRRLNFGLGKAQQDEIGTDTDDSTLTSEGGARKRRAQGTGKSSMEKANLDIASPLPSPSPMDMDGYGFGFKDIPAKARGDGASGGAQTEEKVAVDPSDSVSKQGEAGAPVLSNKDSSDPTQANTRSQRTAKKVHFPQGGDETQASITTTSTSPKQPALNDAPPVDAHLNETIKVNPQSDIQTSSSTPLLPSSIRPSRASRTSKSSKSSTSTNRTKIAAKQRKRPKSPPPPGLTNLPDMSDITGHPSNLSTTPLPSLSSFPEPNNPSSQTTAPSTTSFSFRPNGSTEPTIPSINHSTSDIPRPTSPVPQEEEEVSSTNNTAIETVTDINDADYDDGVGLNGVGFRPTPSIAYARAQKRKQQIADWRNREAREARQRRSERRNMYRRVAGPNGGGVSALRTGKGGGSIGARNSRRRRSSGVGLGTEAGAASIVGFHKEGISNEVEEAGMDQDEALSGEKRVRFLLDDA